MAGHSNFDQELRARWDEFTYKANKRKGGMAGSSKGQPRPYAKQHILKARLFSPKTVGATLTVTPKHRFNKFGPGVYYQWEVIEPGIGIIEGVEVSAQEICDHFVVKQKGKR